jgi:hypothetical protein
MTIIGPETCSTASRCWGLRSFDFSSLFTLALIMSAIAGRGQSEFVEMKALFADRHRDGHGGNRRRLRP